MVIITELAMLRQRLVSKQRIESIVRRFIFLKSTSRNIYRMTETSLSLPSNFNELLQTRFDSAVSSGTLIYSESTSETATVNSINFVYTIAPSLKGKPTGDSTEIPKTVEESPEEGSENVFDPFENPDPELVVIKEFGPAHSIVLNKFAVVPKHFLVITRDFKPQSAPLTPLDLEASLVALRTANSSGRRHIGFFNCGKNSGASVSHRHIQFLELPQNFDIFPDHIVRKHGAENFVETDKPLASKNIPFAHFIVPLPDNASTDDLVIRFSALLSRILTCLRSNNVSDISYNFLFTEEWFMGVPRSGEASDGLGVNAVGAIGLLLAKGQEDLDYIKSKGPLTILLNVAYPLHDFDAKELEYDY